MESPIVCPNCKASNPSGNLFCQSCGSRMGAPAVQPDASQGVPTMQLYPPTQQQPAAYQQPPAAYPQQPAGYPPQGYAPYAQPRPVAYTPPSMKNLGLKVDEFTELYPGMGERAAEVHGAFTKAMAEKNLPGVTMTQANFLSGRAQRPYLVFTHPGGTTMLANIAPAGKDLQIGWMFFAKRILNWIPLAIMGGVALLLPLAWSFIFGQFIASFYFTGIVVLLVIFILGAMLVGKVLRDNPWWAFAIDPDDMAWEDGSMMQTAVHDELIKAVDAIQATPVKKAASDAGETKSVTRTKKTQ